MMKTKAKVGPVGQDANLLFRSRVCRGRIKRHSQVSVHIAFFKIVKLPYFGKPHAALAKPIKAGSATAKTGQCGLGNKAATMSVKVTRVEMIIAAMKAQPSRSHLVSFLIAVLLH